MSNLILSCLTFENFVRWFSRLPVRVTFQGRKIGRAISCLLLDGTDQLTWRERENELLLSPRGSEMESAFGLEKNKRSRSSLENEIRIPYVSQFLKESIVWQLSGRSRFAWFLNHGEK